MLKEKVYSLAILTLIYKCAYAGQNQNRNVHSGGSKFVGAPANFGKHISLRVMSFNTWYAGSFVNNGFQKIAKHINAVNPDIVGLQEINQADTGRLVQLLGKGWTHCSMQQTDWFNVSIVTKRTIVEKYKPADDFSNIACRIELTKGQQVNVFNVHLSVSNYGPHTACIHQPNGDLLKILHDQERQKPISRLKLLSRVNSIVRLLSYDSTMNRINADEEPTILMGDFNSPSGLDWTSETKSLHCGVAYVWPVGKILADKGFIDSYRQVHPNPSTDPGVTWSPVNYNHIHDGNYLEPQDRIDFIYYKGSRISASASKTYVGSKPVYHMPNVDENDWPSDHASVVTDFDIAEQ